MLVPPTNNIRIHLVTFFKATIETGQIRRATRRIFRAVKLLCMIRQWQIALSKATECAALRVNLFRPLGVTVMCLCRVLSAGRTTVLRGINSGADNACVAVGEGRALHFPLTEELLLNNCLFFIVYFVCSFFKKSRFLQQFMKEYFSLSLPLKSVLSCFCE